MSATSQPADLRESPSSLAEHAYRILRDKLIMLDIRPGEPLNDGGLAAELGIGRTPVREALKRLETDHLVISYPRRGTFATFVDITELADVFEVRQLLEPLAARRAAGMSTNEMRVALKETATNIPTLDSGIEHRRSLMRYDITVHRLIYRATGNPHLEETLVRYDNLATRIWCLVVDKLPSVMEHISEHADLLDAIIDGDEERAAVLALKHVTGFEAAIRSVL